jgi:DNA-binding winged helix-turn-helix (wHTH) protein/TolB-like protein/Tfp pilus assembly protein PilF
MSKPLKHFYEFDHFRIDVDERVLLRDGQPVALPPKVFDTLLAIVERSGHIVEKEELMRRLWPDTFVEENNLSKSVSALRKTLGEERREGRYIETVPRRGYRFAAKVREVWGEEEELVRMAHTRLSLRIQEETQAESSAETATDFQPLPRRRLERKPAIVLAITVLLAAVALFVGASRIRRHGSPALARPQIKTLAVLPLQTRSGDEQFLGLSIADDLIARFGKSLHARVRPTNAVYKYMGDGRDAVAAGRELKVDAVLAGEAQRVGERIQLALRLFSTSDGTALWEARFEDDFKNLFAVQESIVNRAAQEVFSVPASALKSVHAKGRTVSPEAHEAYVRGRYLWNNRTAEGLHQSITYFEKAITLDPAYALAFAGLADAYAFDNVQWTKAEATARKALELDPSLGQPHATIGFVRWFWLWDWFEAEREFKLAVALSPEYATAHQWYAVFLAARYYLIEAKLEMERALEIDPFSLPINADLGQILYFMGDFDAAIEQCRRALVLDSTFVNAHIYLYQAYTQKGMYDEAVAEYFRVQEILNGNPSFYPKHERALRAAYDAGGIRGFWKEKLKLEDPFAREVQDQYLRAEYHALLGEKEQALEALSRAAERRSPSVLFAKVNPVFRDLYGDQRFYALLKRVGIWTEDKKGG